MQPPPRLLAILAMLLLPLLWNGPAAATEGFSDGEDLKGWCDNMDMDDIHWGLCVGSITAAHDVVMSYQAADAVNKVVCADLTITRGDAVNAVIEYMNEHPDELIYSLGDVVLSALADKFPCA